MSITWLPTAADVGAIMRARTKADFAHGGQPVGTFDDTTTPTGTQVDELIIEAANSVVARIGDTIPERIEPLAKSAVKYATAMLIELSFWPEQLRTDQSPYKAYEARFDALMKDLALAAAEAANDTEGDFGSSFNARLSRGTFPDSSTIGIHPW